METNSTGPYATCQEIWGASSREVKESRRMIADVYGKVSYWINGPLTVLVALAGICCNLTCVAIFYRFSRPRKNRPRIYHYLFVLAAWEICVLVVASFMYGYPTIVYGQVPILGSYVHFIPYLYPIGNIISLGSVWIMLILTVNRYMAVCYPLFYKSKCSSLTTSHLPLAVVLLFSIVLGLPRFLELTVEYCLEMKANDSETAAVLEPYLSVTDLGLNRHYSIFYRIIGGFLFYSIVPFVIACVLATRITFALRRAVKRRDYLTSGRQRSRRQRAELVETTNNSMLVAVVMKFLASHILPTCLDVLEHTVGMNQLYQNRLTRTLVDLSNFVVVLNSATDFCIYFLWSRNFRRAAASLLRCRRDPFLVSLNSSNRTSMMDVSRSFHRAESVEKEQSLSVDRKRTISRQTDQRSPCSDRIDCARKFEFGDTL